MHVTCGYCHGLASAGPDDQPTGFIHIFESTTYHVAIALHRDFGADAGGRPAPERQNVGNAPARVPDLVGLDPGIRQLGENLLRGGINAELAQRGGRVRQALGRGEFEDPGKREEDGEFQNEQTGDETENETGLGAEWTRAPRLPLAGAEREAVLKVIRDGIAARPRLTAAVTV